MPVNVIVRRWLTLLTLESTVDVACLLFGLVDLNFDDFFARSSCIVQLVVITTNSRLNIRKHFFSQRVVTVWNNRECNNTIVFWQV